MQDVGQHQLLMLLLVVEADLEDRDDALEKRLVGRLDERLDGRVHVGTVGGDLLRVGTRDEPSPRTLVTRPRGDVIGIEEIAETGVEHLVARLVRPEQELLEEPGRMGAMPFRRARIRHRLDDLVLRRQRRRAALRLAADGAKRCEPLAAAPVSRRGRFPALAGGKRAQRRDVHGRQGQLPDAGLAAGLLAKTVEAQRVQAW